MGFAWSSQPPLSIRKIDHEYAVVKPTYVHANANRIELPIPVGGDEIRNLGQALLQRIQWPKRHILIPPKSRAPNSAAQSGATGLDAGTAAHHRAKPQGSQPKSKPPKSQHSQPLPKRSDSQEPPKPQRSQPKQKQPAQQPTHQPKPKTSNVVIAWTKANPNYKPGERMLSEEDSKAAGPACVGLYAYYMEHSAQGKTGILAQVARSYFRSDGDLEWTVQFSDLYDLFNNGGLDVCLLRCWTLKMMELAEEKKVNVGFLDPLVFTATILANQSSLLRAMICSAMKHDFVLGAYNTGGHWILVIIAMNWNVVFYLDSAKIHPLRKFPDVQHIVNR
ncbi:unnamed protein product [Urochloa humidicola]